MEWYHYVLLGGSAWWVFRRIKGADRRADASHALSLVTPFLTKHGVLAQGLLYSSYREAGLARFQGSTVLVGNGKREADGGKVGFAVEVTRDGKIVESLFMHPSTASYHAAEARRAKMERRTLIDALAARDSALQAQLRESDNEQSIRKEKALKTLTMLISLYDDGDITTPEFHQAALGACGVGMAALLHEYDEGELTASEFIAAISQEMDNSPSSGM